MFLPQDGSLIIVGLSGGADSVALLHLLKERQMAEGCSFKIVVTHCNFHLRGNESMRDELFCRNLCQSWGLPLRIAEFDTHAYMNEHHLSLEMAARELRYNWWKQLTQELQIQNPVEKIYIAVAHHLDDCIETTLMNLMRGTGIKGLTGIPSQRDRIVRPLLDWTKADILDYIQEHDLQYVTDSSNLENDVTRNKIRNLLLPLMEEINPNSRHGIALSMSHLQLSERLANERLDEILESLHVHRQAANIEWYEWLIPETMADERMMEALVYRLNESSHQIMRHNRLLYTMPDISQMAQSTAITTDFLLRENISELDGKQEFIYIDADLVKLPVSCRHWRQGDRIQPLGMKGEKLVSDLFSNAHFTPLQKATTWIVTDATDRIIWVKGLRIADWAKVSATTQKVFKIGLIDESL